MESKAFKDYIHIPHGFTRTWDTMKMISSGIQQFIGQKVKLSLFKGDSYYVPGNIIQLKAHMLTYHLEIILIKESLYMAEGVYNITLVNKPGWNVKFSFKCLSVTTDTSCIMLWKLETKKQRLFQEINKRVRLYMQKIIQSLQHKPTVHLGAISIIGDMNKTFDRFLNLKNSLKLFSEDIQLVNYDKKTEEYELKCKKGEETIHFKAKTSERIKEKDRFKITMNIISKNTTIPIQNIVWYAVKIDKYSFLYSLSHICLEAIPREFLCYMTKAKIQFLKSMKYSLELSNDTEE